MRVIPKKVFRYDQDRKEILPKDYNFIFVELHLTLTPN